MDASTPAVPTSGLPMQEMAIDFLNDMAGHRFFRNGIIDALVNRLIDDKLVQLRRPPPFGEQPSDTAISTHLLPPPYDDAIRDDVNDSTTVGTVNDIELAATGLQNREYRIQMSINNGDADNE